MNKLKPIVLFLLGMLSVFLLGGGNTIDGKLIIGQISGGGTTGSIDPPVWEDLRVPLAQARARGAAADAVFSAFKGNMYAFLFADGQDRELHFNAQLPHNYAFGTNLEAHIHWTPTTAGAGNVRWCLEYTLAELDGVYGVGSTTCVNGAAPGVADQHTITDIVSIDGSAIDTVSATIVCRIYREGTDGGNDTYGADVFGLEVDFHYQKDSFGSDQETSKS